MKTCPWAFAQLVAFAPPVDSGAASTSPHDSAGILASSTTSANDKSVKGDITNQRLAADGDDEDDGA